MVVYYITLYICIGIGRIFQEFSFRKLIVFRKLFWQIFGWDVTAKKRRVLIHSQIQAEKYVVTAQSDGSYYDHKKIESVAVVEDIFFICFLYNMPCMCALCTTTFTRRPKISHE